MHGGDLLEGEGYNRVGKMQDRPCTWVSLGMSAVYTALIDGYQQSGD